MTKPMRGMRSPIASMLAVDPFGDPLQPGSGAAFVVLVAFLSVCAAGSA